MLFRSYTGGVVGYNANANTLMNTYNFGLVSNNGGSANTNGIAFYNIGTNNFFDLTLISKFEKNEASKPAILFNTSALETDELIFASLGELSFSSNNWEARSSYYPLLRVFAEHSNTKVKNRILSLNYVDYSNGLGTKNYPEIIKNTSDMTNLSNRVANGSTFNGYYFKIKDGLNELNLGEFKPIGSNVTVFKGNFDGNGSEIILDIKDATNSYSGLFGYTEVGTIKNLIISGNVIGYSYVGGLVGYNNTDRKSVV